MSAEPEYGEVPLETYGGQPPELDAPDLSPNSPIPDANAIPGIDQDPAPVDPGSGLAPEIAVSEIAAASDMHALPSASLPVTVLVAATPAALGFYDSG